MEKKKDLVIVVDSQEDFMTPGGKLYVPGAVEIKENMREFMGRVLELPIDEVDIFYTMDEHMPSDKELSNNPDFVTTFPPHCMDDSNGRYIIPQAWGLPYYEIGDEMIPENCEIYEKNVFSIFEGNRKFLQAYLAADKKRIYILGVAGDICVKAILDDIVNSPKDIPIIVVEDCIASIDENAFSEYIENLNINGEIKIKRSVDIVF